MSLAHYVLLPHYVRNGRVVHAATCHLLRRTPLKRLVTVRLAALPEDSRLCTTCFAAILLTRRRAPVRVEALPRRDPRLTREECEP